MPWVKDYYGILGCSPGADPVVIRAAWRALLAKYHPDVDRSEDAARRLALVNEAWSVLGERESRANYDAELRAPGTLGHRDLRAAYGAPPRARTPQLRRLRPRRRGASGAAAMLGAAAAGTFAAAAAIAVLYTPEGVRELTDTAWFIRPTPAEAGTPSFDVRRMATLRAQLEERQRNAEAAFGEPRSAADGCVLVAGSDATADAREVCPSLGLVAQCEGGRGSCRAEP